MDSHNLATLFGPNVLHRARAVNEKQFMAECAEQAEQSAEVISVVKDMIDNHYDLFEVHWRGHIFFCFVFVSCYLIFATLHYLLSGYLLGSKCVKSWSGKLLRSETR